MTVTSESDLSDCVALLRSNYLVEPGNIGSAKFRISLLQGSYTADTIPPYEPYQPPQEFAVYTPEQIGKVDSAVDEIMLDMDSKTAELTRAYYRYDITGTENWIYETGSNRFYYSKQLDTPTVRQKSPCNRFYSTSEYVNHDNLMFVYGDIICAYMYEYDNAADFKTYLQNNPTYVYLPYSTLQTTDITDLQDWDAMPQVKGTVTLTLSAEVPPSGAEAVYISSRSPKPKVQTISDVVINEADPEHTEASEQEQADEAAALNIEMITYE